MTARLIALAVTICVTAVPQVPADAEIRKILASRIGPENLGIGIVVGVVDPSGRRVVSYGSLAKDDKRKLDGDTVFEIGSISKVFTSLLLMDMVRRGEVSLTDPVAKFLPSSVKIPERNNRKITLADLSTQSSGLPRMPDNFKPKDESNPYADYTVQQMYDFLSGYQLTRDIGSEYEYSNLGVGLLGHVLALRAGMSYEALLRTRICEPLGMKDTRITLTPEMKARLAVGHSEALSAVPNWDLPTFAGAGAIRSTANDMMTFLAANLGLVKTPLAQAMADEVSVRRSIGVANMEIAYGWHVQTKDVQTIIWHNGGTGGYRTYAGFDPKAKAGVVVLSNLSTAAGTDDIGRHLLNSDLPLQKVGAPVEHKEVTIDPTVFDRYTGVYKMAPVVLITVSRDGERFYLQLTGQGKIQMFPESERKFFLKIAEAQLTFDAGQVTLRQGGRDTVAKRLGEAEVQTALEEIKAHNAELAKRLKDQKASPGTEAALRRTIQELQAGEPKYELMSPQFADVTRQQLGQLKPMLEKQGAVQSVTFKSVGPGGLDIYEVKFEHGAMEFRIILDTDGKTLGMGLRQL